MDPENNSGFAIRRYHDVAEIYSRIEKLLAQPIRPVRLDEMEGYLEGYRK